MPVDFSAARVGYVSDPEKWSYQSSEEIRNDTRILRRLNNSAQSLAAGAGTYGVSPYRFEAAACTRRQRGRVIVKLARDPPVCTTRGPMFSPQSEAMTARSTPHGSKTNEKICLAATKQPHRPET
jgi:hypothetical protein